MAETHHDIVDTAVAAGAFSTLVAAVAAAGLVATLKGPGPFTVFAPTDEAFKKLPAGTVETLLEPGNIADLTKILTLHVIAGHVLSDAIVGHKVMPMSLANEALHVDGTNGVTVNGATVVTADILCSNGVIHVIDAVLLPALVPAA